MGLVGEYFCLRLPLRLGGLAVQLHEGVVLRIFFDSCFRGVDAEQELAVLDLEFGGDGRPAFLLSLLDALEQRVLRRLELGGNDIGFACCATDSTDRGDGRDQTYDERWMFHHALRVDDSPNNALEAGAILRFF